MSLVVHHRHARHLNRETIDKQADQLATLEDKFAELEAELKASKGDIDSNTAAVEKWEQVKKKDKGRREGKGRRCCFVA